MMMMIRISIYDNSILSVLNGSSAWVFIAFMITAALLSFTFLLFRWDCPLKQGWADFSTIPIIFAQIRSVTFVTTSDPWSVFNENALVPTIYWPDRFILISIRSNFAWISSASESPVSPSFHRIAVTLSLSSIVVSDDYDNSDMHVVGGEATWISI